MGLVLKGDLTLGMLIAFRIIAGNVTNPCCSCQGSIKASRVCSFRWNASATSSIKIQNYPVRMKSVRSRYPRFKVLFASKGQVPFW